MERYQSLYKDKIQTPREHNLVNRNLQRANRSKYRQDRFLGSRNISLSPTPSKQRLAKEVPETTEDKENGNVKELVQNDANVTRLAKVISKTKDPVKLSNQEAFLKRFIEWKQKHKGKELRRKMEANNKQKPFVSGPFKQNAFSKKDDSIVINSLVPVGHEQFKAPIGLKNPMKQKQKVIVSFVIFSSKHVQYKRLNNTRPCRKHNYCLNF